VVRCTAIHRPGRAELTSSGEVYSNPPAWQSGADIKWWGVQQSTGLAERSWNQVV